MFRARKVNSQLNPRKIVGVVDNVRDEAIHAYSIVKETLACSHVLFELLSEHIEDVLCVVRVGRIRQRSLDRNGCHGLSEKRTWEIEIVKLRARKLIVVENLDEGIAELGVMQRLLLFHKLLGGREEFLLQLLSPDLEILLMEHRAERGLSSGEGIAVFRGDLRAFIGSKSQKFPLESRRKITALTDNLSVEIKISGFGARSDLLARSDIHGIPEQKNHTGIIGNTRVDAEGIRLTGLVDDRQLSPCILTDEVLAHLVERTVPRDFHADGSELHRSHALRHFDGASRKHEPDIGRLAHGVLPGPHADLR